MSQLVKWVHWGGKTVSKVRAGRSSEGGDGGAGALRHGETRSEKRGDRGRGRPSRVKQQVRCHSCPSQEEAERPRPGAAGVPGLEPRGAQPAQTLPSRPVAQGWYVGGTYCAASRASMVPAGLGLLWAVAATPIYTLAQPPGCRALGPPQKSPRGGGWIAQPLGHVVVEGGAPGPSGFGDPHNWGGICVWEELMFWGALQSEGQARVAAAGGGAGVCVR